MYCFSLRSSFERYFISKNITKNKSRKQFKNFLRVLYGNKKDRGFKVKYFIQQVKNDIDKFCAYLSHSSFTYPYF